MHWKRASAGDTSYPSTWETFLILNGDIAPYWTIWTPRRVMLSSTAAPTSRLCDALVAAAIFCACLALFIHSPVSYVGDSKYTLLLTQTLLSKHSFMLDDYAGPPGNLAPSDEHPLSQRPYQVETSRDGHVYYYLPPGGSVLAAPFLFIGDLLGNGVLRKDGTYDLFREEKDQLFIAALLMAALAVIFYCTSRLVLPPAWSATIALGGALGTQIWSTSTRSLCSQTWACLLLGYAVYLLFAHETGSRRLRPAWLATVLSWAYFVRPTSSIAIIGITIYLLLFHRRTVLSYAVTGAAWGAGFVLYSLYHFGTILPAYYAASRLQPETFWQALAGNLISPGRGILIYVPVTLFVVYLVVRFWRERCHPGEPTLARRLSGTSSRSSSINIRPVCGTGATRSFLPGSWTFRSRRFSRCCRSARKLPLAAEKAANTGLAAGATANRPRSGPTRSGRRSFLLRTHGGSKRSGSASCLFCTVTR
jgi:hypothetical protein